MSMLLADEAMANMTVDETIAALSDDVLTSLGEDLDLDLCTDNDKDQTMDEEEGDDSKSVVSGNEEKVPERSWEGSSEGEKSDAASSDEGSSDEEDGESTSSSNDGDGKPAAGATGGELSEYERLRLQRIERNNARLAQLGLLKKTPMQQQREARQRSQAKKATVATTREPDLVPVRRQPRRSARSRSFLMDMQTNDNDAKTVTHKKSKLPPSQISSSKKVERVSINKVCALCSRGDPGLVLCDTCCKPFHLLCNNNAPDAPSNKGIKYPDISSPRYNGSLEDLRCGQCAPCNRDNCGECIYCLDMPRFGGPNSIRRGCIKKVCVGVKYLNEEKVADADVNGRTTDSKAATITNSKQDSIVKFMEEEKKDETVPTENDHVEKKPVEETANIDISNKASEEDVKMGEAYQSGDLIINNTSSGTATLVEGATKASGKNQSDACDKKEGDAVKEPYDPVEHSKGGSVIPQANADRVDAMEGRQLQQKEQSEDAKRELIKVGQEAPQQNVEQAFTTKEPNNSSESSKMDLDVCQVIPQGTSTAKDDASSHLEAERKLRQDIPKELAMMGMSMYPSVHRILGYLPQEKTKELATVGLSMYPSVHRILGYQGAVYPSVHRIVGYRQEAEIKILGYQGPMYPSVYRALGYRHGPTVKTSVHGKFRCKQCCAANRVHQNLSNEFSSVREGFVIRKRLVRCGKCHACTREDCGECLACLDKPKFGGRNTMRQACFTKKCPNMYYKHRIVMQNKDHMKKVQNIVNEKPREIVKKVNINNDICNVCRDGGDLIVCDKCEKAYHFACHVPEIDALPEGQWFCMNCAPKKCTPKKLTPKKIFISDTVNCSVCCKTGDVINCKGCQKLYHLKCHSPPMESNPRGAWKCSECKRNALQTPKKEQTAEKKEKQTGVERNRKEKQTEQKVRYRLASVKSVKLFEGEHDDDCFICFDGGDLLCCDFCEKAFHLPCHIPPLNGIPHGLWKCCECSAVERKKKSRCRQCEACLSPDCGKCEACLDKPKFGGKYSLKQSCHNRRCMYMDFASTVPVVVPSKLVKTSSSKRPRESTANEIDEPPRKKCREGKSSSHTEESTSSKGKKRRRQSLENINRGRSETVKVRIRLSTGMLLPSEYDGTVKIKIRNSTREILSPEWHFPSQPEAPKVSRTKTKNEEQKPSIVTQGRLDSSISNNEQPEDGLRKIRTKKYAGDRVSVKIIKIINGALNDPESSKVQDKACEFLRKISTTAENAAKVVNLGGIKLIKKAMIEHPYKTIVQAEACAALAELIWVDSTNGEKIASEGCIGLMIDALNRHETHLKVQQMGCGAFRALSYDDINKEHITKANGVSVVLSSMKRNSRKTAVLQEGCSFLQNMITLEPEVVNSIIRVKRGESHNSTIIPVILEAMQNNPDNTSFIESACGFLSNLALDKDGSFALAESGAIPVLLKFLNDCGQVELKQAACSSLKHLAMDSISNKRSITSSGGIQAALKASKSFPGDPVIQIACFGLLQELVSYDSANAEAIMQEGAVELIVSAMSEFSDLAQLQVVGCRTLRYFQHNNSKICVAATRNIIAALENHPDDFQLFEEACHALLALSNARRVVPVMKQKLSRKLSKIDRDIYPEDFLSVVDELLTRMK